jgi:small subunit ribosomal protein S20
MANHKSALKRIRLSARQTVVNRDRRNRIRTFVKNVELAITGGDKDGASQALKSAQPEMMRGVSRGILHRNTVARSISRLNARIKAM